MTLSALRGVKEGKPGTTPIGFVLTGNRLVTVRYATPKPVSAFADHVRREPELARDAMTVLVRLLDCHHRPPGRRTGILRRGDREDLQPDFPQGDR